MIQRTPYHDEDFRHLQAALRHWIATAGNCGYIHADELSYRIYAARRTFPADFQRVHLWRDDAAIRGFAINLRFDNAFEVYIAPSLRGTNAEKQILQAAADETLRALRQSGEDASQVIIDVWDCDQARRDALEAIGFERYRVWCHQVERSLSDSIPAPQLPDGFHIRAATMDDYAGLAAVRDAAFDSGWSADAYRDLAMSAPGYQAEREQVVIAPDGRFAAFTLLGIDEQNKLGIFEPVGTHRDFQRRGLARALMLHGLHQMKAQGMERAIVLYDVTNHPAEKLYHSMGFQQVYTTLGYHRLT